MSQRPPHGQEADKTSIGYDGEAQGDSFEDGRSVTNIGAPAAVGGKYGNEVQMRFGRK
jgi:hypothetical protein